MKLPTHIIFGPSPESYYLACGRYIQTEGMPVAFTNKIKEFSLVSWSWISMGPNCETWVARNAQNDNFYFNMGLSEDIRSYLTGTNNHAASNFVTFVSDPGFWFVKHKAYGWYAQVGNFYVNEIAEARKRIEGFDAGLKGILFGHGGNHIYLFQTSFACHLEGDAKNPEHPLHQVLTEYHNESEQWSIEQGSCLCFYDDRYFFLKFKRVGDSNVRLRWNLPAEMQAKFFSLLEKAKTPEEQRVIEFEDLSLTNVVTTRLASESALQTAHLTMMTKMMVQNAKALADMWN